MIKDILHRMPVGKKKNSAVVAAGVEWEAQSPHPTLLAPSLPPGESKASLLN